MTTKAFLHTAVQTVLWGVTVVLAANAQDSPLERGARHFHNGDYARSAEAFGQGVTAGDAACMDFLGFLYLEGYGRRPRPRIAFGYFREAAALGNDQACRNLGNMYFGGRGVDADPVQAGAWWERSVELGIDPRPAFSLGQLHWLGDGVPQNADLARKYWSNGKKLGSDDAVVALAVIEGNASGAAEVEAIRALAVKGHVTALGTLKFFEMQNSRTRTLITDVPFIHQAHNFCALASSTMMLRHQGVKLSQFDVARARSVHEWGHGSHWEEMVSVAGKLGHKWKIQSFANTEEGFVAAKTAAIKELRSGRPLIIDILEKEDSPSAHSILICGYDSQTGEFLARNPALPFPGFQVFPEQRLELIWRSRGFIPSHSELLRPMMLADTAGMGKSQGTGTKEKAAESPGGDSLKAAPQE